MSFGFRQFIGEPADWQARPVILGASFSWKDIRRAQRKDDLPEQFLDEKSLIRSASSEGGKT